MNLTAAVAAKVTAGRGGRAAPNIARTPRHPPPSAHLTALLPLATRSRRSHSSRRLTPASPSPPSPSPFSWCWGQAKCRHARYCIVFQCCALGCNAAAEQHPLETTAPPRHTEPHSTQRTHACGARAAHLRVALAQHRLCVPQQVDERQPHVCTQRGRLHQLLA